MTILYVDPVGGNNANDGLSFANRKRTINSVTTAAVAGDTIRMIASPEPFSVGNADWVDNSRTIAWTNSSNLKIDDCDSGWVASANVTVSHPTDNVEKTGTSYLQCSIASGFTTGKMAYKALPAPLTVSAFQQVATYFKINSVSGSTINFKIVLCSDSTGNTAVAEINKVLVANTDILTDEVWLGLMLDYGSALPGTAINSIAIHLNADPGIRTFSFDSFTACKAPGAADLIDLYSLIGKNTGGEPEWYPVTDLSETGVKVAGHRRANLSTVNTYRNYRGTTELTTTYIRNPLVLASPWATTDSAIKKDLITIDGGWDRTDMSTKTTGETWLCGAQLYAGMNGDSNLRPSVSISDIGFTFCSTGMLNLVVGHGGLDSVTPQQSFLGFLACDTPITYLYSGSAGDYSGYYKLACQQVWGSYTGFAAPAKAGELTVNRIHGFGVVGTNATDMAFLPSMTFEFCPAVMNIGKIDNCTKAVRLASDTSLELKLSGTVIENNTTDFYVVNPSPMTPIRLFLDNMADLVVDTAGGNELGRTALVHSLDLLPSVITQTRINGNPLVNRTVLAGAALFESSQAIRHTASGLAWRLRSFSWYGFNTTRLAGAFGFPIAHVAAEANKLVTVTCWVYIEFDTLGDAAFGLMIHPDITMGLAKVQVGAVMATVGSWQQVTLTFTPSEDGVVPVYAYATGNQDYLTPPELFSAYFDDVEVTQEA